MSLEEWLKYAPLISSVIAACGLFLTGFGLIFTGCQLYSNRLTGDLQALQKFYDDVTEREAALAAARGDDGKMRHAFLELMNHLELYASAFNHKLVIGVGREMVRHKLVDTYVVINANASWHPHIERATDSHTTFIEFRKFIKAHMKQIEGRHAQWQAMNPLQPTEPETS